MEQDSAAKFVEWATGKAELFNSERFGFVKIPEPPRVCLAEAELDYEWFKIGVLGFGNQRVAEFRAANSFVNGEVVWKWMLEKVYYM